MQRTEIVDQYLDEIWFSIISNTLKGENPLVMPRKKCSVLREEENFLFSYNITNLTKTMRKALNRERTNVNEQDIP